MAPLRSIAGRSLGKLLEGFKTSTLGQGFGSGSGGAPLTQRATGGTVYLNLSENRYVHYITSPSDNFVLLQPSNSIRVVIVGGGGAGGGEHGGGGGAGSVVYTQDDIALSSGTYPVSLGNGASFNPSSPGADGGWNRGNAGSVTTFNGITANGGGGGGSYNNNSPGGGGGSGGGGGATGGTGGGTNNPSVPNNYTIASFPGGNGAGTGATQLSGAGGGGGGGRGGDASGPKGGDGGPAFTLPWFPTDIGVNGYIAGGGGGTGYQESNSGGLSGSNVPVVEGGAGRGGFGPENGGLSMDPFFGHGPGGGEDAVNGTGSGGGGARNNTPGGGGAGGRGCVIVSYSNS